MLIAAIQEQLALGGLLNQSSRGGEVPLVGELRISLHPVNLKAHTFRPRRTELGTVEARGDEHRPTRPSPSLGQSLRRQHAERDADVEEIRRQALHSVRPPVSDSSEAERLGELNALGEIAERPPVIEVGRVHRVPTGSNLLSQPNDTVGEPKGVMEQNDRSHKYSLKPQSPTAAATCPRVRGFGRCQRRVDREDMKRFTTHGLKGKGGSRGPS